MPEQPEKSDKPHDVTSRGGTNIDVVGLLKSHSVAVESRFRLFGVIPDIEQGNGFFVDAGKPDQCNVLTDNHVTKSGDITVVMPDGVTHPAKIVAKDLKADMTLLQVDGVPHPGSTCAPLPLASDGQPEGQKVSSVKIERSQGHSFWEVAGLSSPPAQVTTNVKEWSGNALRPIVRSQAPMASTLDEESMQRQYQVYAMDGEAGQSGGAIASNDGKIVSQIEGGGSHQVFGTSVGDIRAFLESQKKNKK